ncbi:MAG: hypothetical protein KAI26_08890 [Nanoarchaeota archaeon]|nr:hypothetical protein [Nanoarchaeota archaeon]
MVNYEKQLAKTALDISAVKLDPNNPFQWASGYSMPIYNDNRILLGSFENRKLASEALKDIVKSKNIEYDMVAGTPTAGIAPAVGLASLLDCPVVIPENGRAFCFDDKVNNYLLERIGDLGEDYDMIASISPYGIVPGVMLANKMKLPFIYVRPKKKEHGMGKQIEGVSPEGKRVFLVGYHVDNNYVLSAARAILKENGGLHDVVGINENISDIIKPVSLKNKSIIAVEDVVSTGGSCVKEINHYRKLGADVKHCLALYGYGMKKAFDLFEENGVALDSAYSYDAVVKEAEDTGYISNPDVDLLKEWIEDPFGWGEKHGFDRVVKK